MLTNFTAGHSLSDYLFDLTDFENSLYCNFLFSPDGLAIPGYVFASNIFGEHYLSAKKRGITPLITVGLLEEVFVPYFNSKVIENGGFKTIANDLLKRDGRGVSEGAREVTSELGSISGIKEHCIPDDKNYGIKTDELVTRMVQERDYIEEEEFSEFWNDDEVTIWRTKVIDEARNRTVEPREDGGHDEGLKVAKVLDVLAEQVGVNPNSYAKESFSPDALFKSMENEQQKQKAERFFKIICFLFNESIAWAMNAQSNWPIQDGDFFLFQQNGAKPIQNNEKHWTDSIEEIIELPSLDTLRVCDSTTLRNIRRIGDEVFFPTYRKWAEKSCDGEELIAQLAEYMNRARRLIRNTPSVKAKCVAESSKQPKLPQVVAISLSGAIGAMLGGAAGLFTIGLDPAATVSASMIAGTGSTLASHYINRVGHAYTGSRVSRKTRMQRIKFGRATDITLLQ